jgi:hypothetical protein
LRVLCCTAHNSPESDTLLYVSLYENMRRASTLGKKMGGLLRTLPSTTDFLPNRSWLSDHHWQLETLDLADVEVLDFANVEVLELADIEVLELADIEVLELADIEVLELADIEVLELTDVARTKL